LHPSDPHIVIIQQEGVSEAREVTMLDIVTNKVKRYRGYTHLLYHPECRYTRVFVRDNNTIQIWNFLNSKKLKLIEQLNLSKKVRKICFHPKDSNLLIVLLQEGEIIIWSYLDNKTQELDGHRRSIYSLEFHKKRSNIFASIE